MQMTAEPVAGGIGGIGAGKLERYGFLDDLVPKHRVHGVRRAEGTFASASDALTSLVGGGLALALPVRSVEAAHVFELGFEGVNRSRRHKSGVAVRFPRILRWRRDKPMASTTSAAPIRDGMKSPANVAYAAKSGATQ